MTTLQQLLAAHPEAVKDIDDPINRGDSPILSELEPWAAARTIRAYAWNNGYGDDSYILDIESLLTAIDAKLKAERGLTDAEIEGMKWKAEGRGVMHNEIVGSQIVCLDDEEANDAVAAQHACVDRLWQDIRRLRAKCGEVADAR